MPKNLKYICILLGIAISVFSQGSLAHAQAKGSYTVLITGNIYGKTSNSAWSQKWQNETTEPENFAYLLAGNVVDGKTGTFPENLTTNESKPVLIVPGKAEWANGSRKGKDFIKQLPSNFSEKFKNPVHFIDDACPGPEEIILTDYLVVILIDTYWWVHKFDRRFSKCGIETPADILMQTEDIIRRHYNDKHIIVAGHHSLRSQGNTSGHFSSRQWLLKAPYIFFRKLPGSRRDNQHPDFKEFRKGLLSLLKKYPELVYASAGEANLQYFSYHQTHFVISGSWQDREYVRKKQPAFGSDENGYARLDFSSSGECSLSFVSKESVLFKKTIYHKKLAAVTPGITLSGELPDSIMAVASYRYNITGRGYKWLGKNYRNIWETPVKVPVFNLGEENGGLHILKRGGGQQTYSLRMEDNKGKQYVLRSIDKQVEGAMPNALLNTFAVDLVQDQVSASNPYAAPVVAALAGYSGIFHVNPRVVYVHDDPRLGIYQRDVAGRLFIFEERPDGECSHMTTLGRPQNIISTEKVIEKITYSPYHYVDVGAVLRARLFDIVINDWDRHDDQWRWAGFSHNRETAYTPIPRDRDQAFFVNNGILPWIASRKWLLPKIQGFTEFTQNMEGQSFNARFFDRTFLSSANWDDWLRQTDSLKTRLTPSKIDSAMYLFPKEIYPLCGPETKRIMMERIKNLEPMARKLYLSLAKEVSVAGTREPDFFEIKSSDDTTVTISVYHLNKDGEKGRLFFHRQFFASETRMILLYGLEGEDIFELTGNRIGKIAITIIGGKGRDKIKAKEKFYMDNIVIYDDIDTEVAPEIRKKLKSRYDQHALEYNRENFKYDIIYPGIYSGYNPDDGIFLGGGPIFTKYSRYQQQRYEMMGNYASATNAYNLRFKVQKNYPLKRMLLDFNVDYSSPGYVGNFVGMGNVTRWDPSKPEGYYRLRMSRSVLRTGFVRWLDPNQLHQAGVSLSFNHTGTEKTKGRYVSLPGNGLDENDLSSHFYTGIHLNYKFDTSNTTDRKPEEKFAGSSSFPTRGMKLETAANYFTGINKHTGNFLKVSADWMTYLSFSQRPRVIYVLRLGGEKIVGNYPFHEAAKLGGKENLKGYRETRYYGDASIYLNALMRIRMKQFQTYLVNGTAGVLFFNDTGRVWLKGEESKRWHNGAGLGLWISPFDTAVLSASLSSGNDGKLFNFSLNYHF